MTTSAKETRVSEVRADTLVVGLMDAYRRNTRRQTKLYPMNGVPKISDGSFDSDEEKRFSRTTCFLTARR